MINSNNIAPSFLWDFKDLTNLNEFIACSRGSNATMFLNGLLVTKSSNVIRFEKGNGILCEASATNLCLQSRLLDQTGWTSSGTLTTTGCIGLDGVSASCCKATGGESQTYQQFTLIKNTYTLSFYIKNLSTDSTFQYSLDGIEFETITATNQWQRVTLTKVITNPKITFIIPDNVMVDGVQLEVGNTATSLIPTTTTQETRAADVITVDFENFNQSRNYLSATMGAWVVGARLVKLEGNQCLFYGADSNEYIKMLIERTSEFMLYNVGFNQDFKYKLTADPLNAQSQIYMDNILAAVYGQGSQFAAVNSVIPTLPSAQAQTVNLTNFDTLYLGCQGSAGVNHLTGYITMLAYYNYKIDEPTASTATANNTDLFVLNGGGSADEYEEWNQLIASLFIVTDPLSNINYPLSIDEDLKTEEYELISCINMLNLTNNN